MTRHNGGKHRAPSQSRSLAARGTAVTTLAVGLAGYGLTTASTASAADCVSGAAAAYSTRPLCKHAPIPSEAEQTAKRVADGILSGGFSEVLNQARVSTDSPEGCLSPSAAAYSGSPRPLCDVRPLTDTEKTVSGIAYTAVTGRLGLPTLPSASLPKGLQPLYDSVTTYTPGAKDLAEQATSLGSNGGSDSAAQIP